MTRLPRIESFCSALLATFAVSTLTVESAQAQLTLSAGDVAIIGWQDDGTPIDVFTIVALSELPAGTRLYFTDNGWTGTGFRNSTGASDGDGDEQLTRLTINTLIPAGTIISSDELNGAFTWTVTGPIPSTPSGSFGPLQLSSSGDQIYAFQHNTLSNPLNTAQHLHIYALDDTGSFESATSTSSGGIPFGLSASGHTAVTFLQTGTFQNSMAFNTGSLASGTKNEWLSAIANASNWSFGTQGALPSGTLNVVSCPAIVSQRQDELVCDGGTASFTVVASNGPLTYQWRKNGTPLLDGGNISGAQTATLTIAPVHLADLANYDVVVGNDCGTITSTLAVLGFDPSDTDGDATPNCSDGCPLDPTKIAPGVCGCGVPDTDADGDGVANCQDGCPLDPLKVAPGVCGCGTSDVDSDGDAVLDCLDGCPNDPLKTTPGVCGCGVTEADSDGDGVPNCNDGCPNDQNKIAPGQCGCGVADTDTDGDGTANCIDGCPNDPLKTNPGVCGCGVADTDSDGDGVPNCNDGCPNDPNKVAAGQCGCGTPDTDSDGDGTANCLDGCPNDPNKVAPGTCGCGVADLDSDGDLVPNCNDGCPNDPLKTTPGACGCGVLDTDSDGDLTPNCHDGCPNDPLKTSPGQCGCGVSDGDSDGDGTANCVDGCPSDPLKTTPGVCGCGQPETDTDGDGVVDCIDNCPALANPLQFDADRDGVGNLCDNCEELPNPMQEDCDDDGLGDVCEIEAGAPDCNNNQQPDACDIALGVSSDSNGDSIPDECEIHGGIVYCFGDGSGTACPCDNYSQRGAQQGCMNSFGFGGMLIGTGSAIVTDSTLTLNASLLPPGASLLFFQGSNSNNNGAGTAVYDGLVCAGGAPLIRLATKTIARDGTATFPEGGDPTIAVKGQIPAGGGTRYYQAWYRNALGPCGTFSNFSNGLLAFWVP